ncbi:MAG: hypothetical protein HRT87_01805 [Legionellales bacterium]|nr:hypothetical protein [Legionellales bacterium]
MPFEFKKEYEKQVQILDQSGKDPQKMAQEKAMLLYNGLKKSLDEIFTDPNHTILKYVNSLLLGDVKLLSAFNELRKTAGMGESINISTLIKNEITLAEDYQDLVNKYSMVMSGIENHEISKKNQHQLITEYVSQILDNDHNNNLENIDNSDLSSKAKNDLKARYLLEYANHHKGNFYETINTLIQDQAFTNIIQDQELLNSLLESIPEDSSGSKLLKQIHQKISEQITPTNKKEFLSSLKKIQKIIKSKHPTTKDVLSKLKSQQQPISSNQYLEKQKKIKNKQSHKDIEQPTPTFKKS